VFYRNNEPIARLSGALDIDALKTAVKNGQRGPLGVRGQTVMVAEPSLMQTIKKRMAKINWAKEKRHAVKYYWAHLNPPVIPQARKTKTFTFDPSVVVARTLKTPKGK